MENKEKLFLASSAEMDAVKTFECGQCFRWNRGSDGGYTGVVCGAAAKVTAVDGAVYLRSSAPDKTEFWREYFDLDVDYQKVSSEFFGGEYMQRCVDFGMGIRLLRQEPWEALCSFIISQCNNIPRIKKIVETLCSCFGEPFEFDGEVYHAFPSAERIAALSTEELAPLRCGYRAPYIISAARAVAEGRVEFSALERMSFDEAIAQLRKLDGVGPKVANCMALYGLHKMSGFPIDTWMKRALKEHFPPDFDPKSLGEYAGLAQQYIFYYARSGGK